MEEALPLSGIQHFAYCRRQWALIHVEGQWMENLATVEGKLMHEHAHDPLFEEKRADRLITRAMAVHSDRLGITGVCDVVEFHADPDGVKLFGRGGAWLPRPVEYKRGNLKVSDADQLQLCAQAICLEEMLLCPTIDTAYLYHGKTRHREPVELTRALRDKVEAMVGEMWKYYRQQYTPRVKPIPGCKGCSLNEICLPKLPRGDSVQVYLDACLKEADV
jgi:CRISPR-associated exonuclease Cas4